MDLLTIDEGLRNALATANFGPHLKACAYRFIAETDGEYLAEAVLIIDQAEWDSVASEACKQAREEVKRVVSDIPILVMIVCRSIAMHTAASSYEHGIWTAVNPSVPCG